MVVALRVGGNFPHGFVIPAQAGIQAHGQGVPFKTVILYGVHECSLLRRAVKVKNVGRIGNVVGRISVRPASYIGTM